MARSDLPGQIEVVFTDERKANLAQLKADAKLRPDKPQKPCDRGLFGDDPLQVDLEDLL